ncbi:hypothetical protein [Streptomyces tendae]|uniref:hypothetical protein n=1 Tax=Streptomyces tendae TaxID=1932 RepID=UPI002493BC5A|nr:hypothetical protein [Streptomyces tendae]
MSTEPPTPPAGQPAGQPPDAQNQPSGPSQRTPEAGPFFGPQPGNPTVWVSPPDPDRYAREQSQLARDALAAAREANRSSRRSNRIAIAACAVAAVLAALALYPQFQTNSRDQAEVDEKESVEAGSPVKLSPGESFNYSGWWVTDSDLGDKHFGDVFDTTVYDYNKPSFAWLFKHWTPLNWKNASFNTLSVHEKTTVVQGVEISNLNCKKPISRTILASPEIGSGGDLTPPAEYAVDVEAPKPALRKLVNDRPGELAENLTLEQGDQRTIQISFFSTKRACTFEASLKVSSNGKTHKVKLPSLWDSNDKAETYTFRVSPPPGNLTYDSYYKAAYVPETALHPKITSFPSRHVVWHKGNPEYVGPMH